jgi:hypothetical protein
MVIENPQLLPQIACQSEYLSPLILLKKAAPLRITFDIIPIQFSGIASKIVVFFCFWSDYGLNGKPLFPFHKHQLALTLPDAPEWLSLVPRHSSNDSTTLSPVKQRNVTHVLFFEVLLAFKASKSALILLKLLLNNPPNPFVDRHNDLFYSQ